MDEAKTLHGAKIYQMWINAGGTHEKWVAVIAPILKDAGPGPLYRVTQKTLDDIISEAK